MGYFQELLPWPILFFTPMISSLFIFIYAISVWRAKFKVFAIGLFLMGLSSFILGINYFTIGLKNGQQFIPDMVINFLFALSVILLYIGAFIKLKREDTKRLKHLLIFTGTCLIIMISLLIYINIYS